jgi:hypothetical protein
MPVKPVLLAAVQTGLIQDVRINNGDPAAPARAASVVSSSGDDAEVKAGLLVAAGTFLTQLSALPTGAGRIIAQDDNARLLVSECIRQVRVRGTIQENAFGANGTATLVAAPGANLANVLRSVQFGAPTATTVVTLESPLGTVLWAARLILTVVPPPIVLRPGLTGGTNGLWAVRSSIASTFSVNGQGFTERVA